MRDSYYSSPISKFLRTSNDEILGELTRAHHHALEHQQRNAWLAQIDFLKTELRDNPGGHLFLEFSIPRMGKRADVVLVRCGIIFVIEFKVNSATFDGYAIDQVHDYALDLKNFHLGSHELPIVPVLCATEARNQLDESIDWAADLVAEPILIGRQGLRAVLDVRVPGPTNVAKIDVNAWRTSGYRPTPTIIEAAEALYRNHAVDEISRSDAGAKNLQATSEKIAEIIERSKCPSSEHLAQLAA